MQSYRGVIHHLSSTSSGAFPDLQTERWEVLHHVQPRAEDFWNAAPSFNEGSLLKKSIPFFVSTTNLPLCTLFNYLPLK